MRILKTKISMAQAARLNHSLVEVKKPLPDAKLSIYDFKEPSVQAKCEEPICQLKVAISPSISTTTGCPSPTEVEIPQPKRRKRSIAQSPQKQDGAQCTKNIAINYGKAIASFAASDLALPYLEVIVPKEGILISDFTEFIRKSKESIGGIDSFRNLLLAGEGDEPKTAALKRTLRQVGEIFIKYFSVNWICNGRVTHKIIYLKYRNKMLRRVQNPEYFTYVKEHKKKK